MKKFFPEKKLTKKKFMEFLEERGFYIVLVLCILVIGATALFVTKYNIPSSNKDFNTENIIPDDIYDEFAMEDEENYLQEGSIDVPATTSEEDEASKVVDGKENAAESTENTASEDGDTEEANAANKEAGQEAKETVAQVEKVAEGATPKSDGTKSTEVSSDASKAQASKETSANNESASVEVSNQASQGFISPVLGEIIGVFAQDRLIYSKTLDQWRAHSGIDLAADRGTPVRAVANGVVVDVKNDPRWGITVVIEHDNGLRTVYANLASDEMVVQNEKVAQGDIIGCVGNTAAFESAEQPHLHFEVWKDDKPVNPEDYINK
ncbi:MAG TPA: peptidoglycan DD-metalloendopeptidase family protein [Clostridiaceae bacterium]|nr:peptidoglycan DD-metalloendopeptidase family protein [Clostridiaceae bacterium]